MLQTQLIDIVYIYSNVYVMILSHIAAERDNPQPPRLHGVPRGSDYGPAPHRENFFPRALQLSGVIVFPPMEGRQFEIAGASPKASGAPVLPPFDVNVSTTGTTNLTKPGTTPFASAYIFGYNGCTGTFFFEYGCRTHIDV
jgi:hypothetical protein